MVPGIEMTTVSHRLEVRNGDAIAGFPAHIYKVIHKTALLS